MVSSLLTLDDLAELKSAKSSLWDGIQLTLPATFACPVVLAGKIMVQHFWHDIFHLVLDAAASHTSEFLYLKKILTIRMLQHQIEDIIAGLQVSNQLTLQ